MWRTALRLASLIMATGACAPAQPPVETAAPSSLADAPVKAVVGPMGDRSLSRRFISVNIPNLHYIEDDWRFDSTQRYRLPSEFEIRDALEAVRQMGGQVVRIYALSVRKADDPPSVPRHVIGPGQFDEEAFRALDLVLALAREYGIQVIIPFVDNWQWWGGIAEYATFRNLPKDAFWSDEQLFQDYRQTIEFVVTRKNSFNGVIYRDDPTIFAWETGNELEAPWDWTERAAAAIRELDAAHPIADGIHSRFIRQQARDSSLIDILTTHHYTDGEQMVEDVRENARRIAGAKPYFVGEFGFIPAADVARVLDTVIEEEVMGAMIWSLRFRNRDGGFYNHGEKPGFESYHWPGFASGQGYQESEILSLLQDRAHRLTASKPSHGALSRPGLLPHSEPNALYWQGSAGATGYDIERSSSPGGPWEVVASGVSDAAFPYRPQYVDTTAPLNQELYYRVQAVNAHGKSAPSPHIGPVRTQTRRLVDEFEDSEVMSESVGELQQVSDEPMTYKMDRTRLRSDGATLIYAPPGELRAGQLDVFLQKGAATPRLSGSSGKGRWRPVEPEVRAFAGEVDVPEWPKPTRLRMVFPPGTSALRIEFADGVDLGRLELDFIP